MTVIFRKHYRNKKKIKTIKSVWFLTSTPSTQEIIEKNSLNMFCIIVLIFETKCTFPYNIQIVFEKNKNFKIHIDCMKVLIVELILILLL